MTTTTTPLSRADHVATMARYVRDGEDRGRGFGNRGPVRFDEHGRLHSDILAAYREHGFYVFQDVIDAPEIAELRADVTSMIERAPVRTGAAVDVRGRPALGRDHAVEPYLLVKPLSDPWGGTDKLSGRHPSKMAEPTPEADAPDEVPFLIFGMCMTSPAALRLYGHPSILAVAAAINGADFVPFNDAIFVKQPGLGGSVAWHQDGVTHWGSPHWDMGIHGFNVQVQLHPTTAANALWVVPGTHKAGRVDIRAKVAANGGSDRLPDAIPLLCAAGDVTIVNRQTLHGSFANTSADPRVSITYGFHRRSSVLDVVGKLSPSRGRDVQRKPATAYDAQRVFDRSAVIAVAIDARHQHRPNEPRFRYEPFAGLEDDFRYGPQTIERVLRDYNLKDLSI